MITAAEDKKIRWWDLRTQSPVGEYSVDGVVGSCELDPCSDGVLSVAAGKSVYFFDSMRPGALIKSVKAPYELASVALHSGQGKFVTGGGSQNDTWVRVWDFNEERELGTLASSGLSGEKVLTRWQRRIRVTMAPFGLLVSRLMENFTPLEVKMALSSSGNSPMGPTVCGDDLVG